MLLARPTTNPLRLPHAHGAHAPGWFSFWYTRSSSLFAVFLLAMKNTTLANSRGGPAYLIAFTLP
jgi:hypothetical protein